MTLRGFASLDLISPVACRPCDADRSGISIGEAAGFALLEREGAGIALLGCGTSSDGYHMSAPHPQRRRSDRRDARRIGDRRAVGRRYRLRQSARHRHQGE